MLQKSLDVDMHHSLEGKGLNCRDQTTFGNALQLEQSAWTHAITVAGLSHQPHQDQREAAALWPSWAQSGESGRVYKRLRLRLLPLAFCGGAVAQEALVWSF